MSFQSALRCPMDPAFLGPWSWSGSGMKMAAITPASLPASGAYISANRGIYTPISIARPFSLQRFWWLNGSTVGTDSLQAAIYDDAAVGPGDCIVSTARTLSAGTVSQVQYATCSVVAHGITSGTSTTDGNTFVTASVTLKARPGLMYAITVVNTHGTSANASSAATTGGAYTFTGRDAVLFNSSQGRVSLKTLVPTADVTDTITITIGSGQTATGCAWSLVAFTNVDTTTNDGIVQTATGNGSGTTPSATLAAFGSSNNATFGGFGTAQTAATPGTGFIEIHDATYSTPTTGIQTQYTSANDTSVDCTITSAAWGAVAAEVKSLGTTRTLGPGAYYLALHCTGTTATLFRTTASAPQDQLGIYEENSLTAGLPLVPTPVSPVATLYLFGITNRSTP